MEGNSFIGEIFGLFIYPITAFQKRAEERNFKKEGRIALVLALVMGLMSILNSYLSVTRKINNLYPAYEKYHTSYSFSKMTEEEYKEEKNEAKKEELGKVEFIKNFFKTIGVILLAICLLTVIMFIISKLVKDSKDFIELLSMSNSALLIYFVGSIVSLIFSFIYTPI